MIINGFEYEVVASTLCPGCYEWVQYIDGAESDRSGYFSSEREAWLDACDPGAF